MFRNTCKKKDQNPNKQKIKQSLDLPAALTSPNKGFLQLWGWSAHPSLQGVPQVTQSPPASGLGGSGDDLYHFLIKLTYVRKFQMSALCSAKAVGEKRICTWDVFLWDCVWGGRWDLAHAAPHLPGAGSAAPLVC